MKKVFLIVQESGEYSSFSSDPVAIYENYDDALFDIACRHEAKKQAEYISYIKGDWYREHEYKICVLNLNDSNGDPSFTYDYEKYKYILESQKYIKFVENLTENNKDLLTEAHEKAERRKKEKAEAEAKKIESDAQKFKEILEDDKNFANNYFKIESKLSSKPNQEIINRISRAAMHTNDRDMIEWVLKHR